MSTQSVPSRSDIAQPAESKPGGARSTENTAVSVLHAELENTALRVDAQLAAPREDRALREPRDLSGVLGIAARDAGLVLVQGYRPDPDDELPVAVARREGRPQAERVPSTITKQVPAQRR